MALYFYPTDEVSREQVLALLADQRLRNTETGNENDTSDLLRLVIEPFFLKGWPSRAVAGLMTLVFYVAALNGRKDLSQYAAANIVVSLFSDLAEQASRPITVKKYQSGQVKRVSLRAASSRTDIEKRFRDFRALGPIIAAQSANAVFAAYFAEVDEQGIGRQELRLAAEIESTVEKSFPQYFPNQVGLNSQISMRVRTLPKHLEFGEIQNSIQERL